MITHFGFVLLALTDFNIIRTRFKSIVVQEHIYQAINIKYSNRKNLKSNCYLHFYYYKYRVSYNTLILSS